MNIEQLVQSKLQQVFKDNSLLFDKSWFAGGLTNHNYIMEIHGKKYVIRQPGNMTHLMIDRAIEQVNNSIASEFGVNSTCVFFDAESGIKISEFIENSSNIAVNPNAPENIQGVSTLLQTIHQSPKHFPNRFYWTDELAKYEGIIQQLNGDVFFDYDVLKQSLLQYMDEYVHTTTIVPCHNDTVPENFLIDNNGRTYLVDWEYAGMNDPCWDIAAYIVESRLTKEAIDLFMHTYFGKNITQDVYKKVQCYIMAQDLLWAAWSLIRHYSGDDFLDYCSMRYERFRRNVNLLIIEKLPISLDNMVKN